MFVLCLGTLEIRELYALMMMRLPWALCLKEFWICNPRMSVLIKVYIDLVMSAMLFRKPECGNYLDILGVGEIHMLEFFCGQVRHQVVCTVAGKLPAHAGQINEGIPDDGLQNTIIRYYPFPGCITHPCVDL